MFRQEGDYWTIAYQSMVCRLKDTRGLHFLAHLLRHPHKDRHAIDVVTAGVEAGTESPAGHSTATLAADLAACGTRVSDLNDAGNILDPQAKTAYKQRLADLREELEEAEEFNDLARTDQLKHEIEFLTQELAHAIGLGGRHRKAASLAERARVNVTRAVKLALDRL